MNDRDERALRADIVAKARWMNAAGLNQGTSGNISARYKDVLLITPSATPLRLHDARDDRRDAARRRVRLLERTLESIDGMAISLRHHQVATRRWRDRAYAFDLCDRPRDSPQRDTGVSLYDRGLRGSDDSLRWLCPLRNEGTLGPRPKSPRGTKRLPARQSWHARASPPIWRKRCGSPWSCETIARQYYLSLALGDPFILSDEQIAETARGFATYGLQAAPREKTAPRRTARR